MNKRELIEVSDVQKEINTEFIQYIDNYIEVEKLLSEMFEKANQTLEMDAASDKEIIKGVLHMLSKISQKVSSSSRKRIGENLEYKIRLLEKINYHNSIMIKLIKD